MLNENDLYYFKNYLKTFPCLMFIFLSRFNVHAALLPPKRENVMKFLLEDGRMYHVCYHPDFEMGRFSEDMFCFVSNIVVLVFYIHNKTFYVNTHEINLTSYYHVLDKKNLYVPLANDMCVFGWLSNNKEMIEKSLEFTTFDFPGDYLYYSGLKKLNLENIGSFSEYILYEIISDYSFEIENLDDNLFRYVNFITKKLMPVFIRRCIMKTDLSSTKIYQACVEINTSDQKFTASIREKFPQLF